MDISSFSSQNSKLLDALEKLGSSEGADLKSSGPTGDPSPELVLEFELALQGISPDSVGQIENTQMNTVDYSENNVQDVQATNSVELVENDEQMKIIEIESVDNEHISIEDLKIDDVQNDNNYGEINIENTAETSSSQDVNSHARVEENQRTEANNPEEMLKELETIVDQINQGSMSATDLFRAQYLAAMFSMHTTSGTKVSQQAAQGIESVLKQQ